tara:strand:+ start:575 stop:787 length:213 start_codon:yes stop_codon:yes gene_type:complete
MSCQLPKQTTSYSFCLNDDVIMEGVSVITNTNECKFNQDKNIQTIKKEPVYYKNQIVESFDDYYKLLLHK